MNNLETYNTIFIEVFQVNQNDLGTDFNSDNIDKWDSICQLGLVTNMEDAFDVMLEPEDIMNFKSYDLGKTILAKYEIVIL